jgi:hypothetical protein
VTIGDFEVEITSARVGGGWQAVGILPDGKKVVSGPSSSRETAEDDVKQQAEARLYPQRRYDVNRPFESMKNCSYCSKREPCGCRKGARKPLSEPSDGLKQFRQDRSRSGAARDVRRSLSMKEMAVVKHLADQLLEELPGEYEIHPDTGEEVKRPRCPHCGGPGQAGTGSGQFVCVNCGSKFAADMSRYDTEFLRGIPAKASFYPSDGGSGGGGGGITTA